MRKENLAREHGDRTEVLWREVSEGHDVNENEGFGRSGFVRMAHRLERYRVADPTEEQTERLLVNIAQWMEKTGEPPAGRILRGGRAHSLWLRGLQAIAPQMLVFSRWFWIATAFLIGLGAVLMPLVSWTDMDLFVIVTPLVPCLGIVYALHSFGTPMADLEKTMAVAPGEMVLGRMAVLTGYNILLALAASGMLALFGKTGALHVFIASWLVPMFLYLSFAFAIALRFGVWTSGILSVALWAIQVFGRERLGAFYILESRGLALALTVACSAFAVYGLRRLSRGGTAIDDLS